MDERPTPPLASEDAYEAPGEDDGIEAPKTNGQGFDAVAEFTVPVGLPRPRLAPIPFNDIQLGTNAVYLVKGLIPREGLVVIWGPPKCGKSFWTFDLNMHIALGWEYRGRRVKQGAIVYVACEGQQGFRARIEAFRQRHLSENVADIPFYLVPASLDLIAEHEDLILAIRSVLGNTKPVATIFDTLNRSIQGDENSSEDMTAYIRAAEAIQTAFGCVSEVVHHCGVEGKRPRGHTSLTGACDAQIAVKREDSGTIITTLEWAKDGPEGDEIYSGLEPVDVGIDEDGETITSCIIVEADNEASTTHHKITGKASIALDMLTRAIEEAGEIPPANSHIPENVRAVRTSTWKRYCEQGSITDSDKPDTQDKAFRRASERLQERGWIGVWGEWVWVART